MRLRAVVGAKGQVVIPKEVRDFLNIREGCEVVFEVKGDVVELRLASDVGLEDYVGVVPRERRLKERVDVKKLILEEAGGRSST